MNFVRNSIQSICPNKFILAFVFRGGTSGGPAARLMPSDERVKILHISSAVKANCCTVVRFTSFPRSPLRVGYPPPPSPRAPLAPPSSEGVYVIAPRQPNRSLSILKFRFLFHGLRGTKGRFQLFFSPPAPCNPSATSPPSCVRID